MFYVTTRALKHHGRNAILLDPTSYSSVATDAATHVLMNVFARNRNTYPSFFHTRKELEKEHFIFLLLNEQSNNVAKVKITIFLEKKKNKIKEKYIISGEILFISSHVSITKTKYGRAIITVFYEMYRAESRMMVHDRKSKRSKTRGLSPSLPGTSRSNESSMAPLDVGQTAGLTMGPYCQERGFLQAHLCQRNVRGSEPRTLHRVRPWMTCALRESFVATSSQSFFLFFLFFFFHTLPFLPFFPSLLPRQQPRLLLAPTRDCARGNVKILR